MRRGSDETVICFYIYGSNTDSAHRNSEQCCWRSGTGTNSIQSILGTNSNDPYECARENPFLCIDLNTRGIYILAHMRVYCANQHRSLKAHSMSLISVKYI